MDAVSHLKFSVVNIEFVFNASLNDLAPSSPKLLPAWLCWLLAVSAIHPSSSLFSCSQYRSRNWSVVLTFNASLSAHAPSSQIMLSVLFVYINGVLLFCSLLFMPTRQVQGCQCCVDLQCHTQCSGSLIWDHVDCCIFLVNVGSVWLSSFVLLLLYTF